MRDNPNLDLMRGFAVLLVISSHLWLYTGATSIRPEFAWFLGTLGVAIFFTHTTLVLMWSLERDPHTLRFYVRRVFRLYPLWLVVLAGSVLVHLPTSPAYAPAFRFYHAPLQQLGETALLVFNLFGIQDNIIGASWSPPVELQMYVVLPFLFFFMRSNRGLLALLLLDALAASTAYRTVPAMGHSLLFCAPMFIPGAIAYQIYRRQHDTKLPGWTFVMWLLTLTEAVNLYASRSRSSFRPA